MNVLLGESTLTLANILTGETGAQHEQVQKLLAEFKHDHLEIEKLVNAPLKQHKMRTAVHLAAANDLPDCLEVLLKSGGVFK